MALFVRQNENRTELQQKIAAELQQKSVNKAREDDRPDGVEDSQYLKNTKSTTSLAWVWLLIFVGVVALIVWLIVR